MKEKKADVIIHDAFMITGRGLVLAGIIEQGDFSAGDHIEFMLSDTLRSYPIKGIEMIRRDPSAAWQKQKYGLLIERLGPEEEQKIKEACKAGIPAVIYAG
jgi:translation elongation factor EF-Tu-like GTPase